MLTAMLAASLFSPVAAHAAVNEAEISTRIKAIQKTLNSLAGKIESADSALAFAQQRVARHQKELRVAQQQLLPLRAALGKRAAQLYILGGTSFVQSAFESTDLATFVDRTTYLQSVSGVERGLYEKLAGLTHRSKTETKELRVALADAETAKRSLRSQRSELDARMSDLQSLYNLIQLNDRVTVRASRTRVPGFVCPVAGPHALMNNYGAPRPGGPHTGDDLSSPYGTPTVAVLSGTVSQIVYGGWMGLGIILRDGAGNEWWYAHLGSRTVSVGQHVNGGEQIGRVGCSGNCSGSHLHFEYHPGGGGPVNPYRILSRVC